MILELKYYDQEDGELYDSVLLRLDNTKFDEKVANTFTADFDRCEHGRHQTDHCLGCEAQYQLPLSRGNPGCNDETFYTDEGDRIYAYCVGGGWGWTVRDGELIRIKLDF